MSVLPPSIDIPCTCRVPQSQTIGFCWWCHFWLHVRNISREFRIMWEKYRYGYLTASVGHMLLRLNEEIEEISSTRNYGELYAEVLDVVNVGMMLLEIIRIKETSEWNTK